MFNAGFVLLTAALTVAGQNAAESRRQAQAVPKACLVGLIEDSRVSAKEEGVLVELEAREGLEVAAETLLGHIDDTKAQMELEIARNEFAKATETAKNDVNVRFAEKSAMVSKYEYEQAIETNRRKPKTISHTEEMRRLFAFERDKLRIEQAEFEQNLAGLDAKVKEAQFKAAEENVARRQLVAPFEGEILEVFHHRGEWVTPGDPIFRMAEMNRLRVDGWLNADEFNAGDVANRPVTVKARLAQGEVEFTGKVVWADKVVQTGREFRVRAEVENRKDDRGQWLLRPGLGAEMIIDLAPRTSYNVPPEGDLPSLDLR